MKPKISESIKIWRLSNQIKQSHLAVRLGVSQQAVSSWERGNSEPSPQVMGRLRGLIGSHDPLITDREFIRVQSSIRSLIDVDGARILEYSNGFASVWGRLDDVRGKYLEDKLINELGSIMNSDLRSQILAGDIALISGVSERHLDLDLGPAFLHRWHACFRRYGSRVITEAVFERVGADEPKGVNLILRTDELSA